MFRTFAVVVILFVSGCKSVATHERPMNESEPTMVSQRVAAMLDENGGTLDTREHDNVRCERIKITGSHMVTRLCFTKEEETDSIADNQNKMRDRFGMMKCLDPLSPSCNAR